MQVRPTGGAVEAAHLIAMLTALHPHKLTESDCISGTLTARNAKKYLLAQSNRFRAPPD